MSVEQKLDNLIQKIEADRKQSDKDRHENRMWIFWSFTLATLSLAVANPSKASLIIASIVFFIFGWVEWFRTYRPSWVEWFKSHQLKAK